MYSWGGEVGVGSVGLEVVGFFGLDGALRVLGIG